MHPDTQYQMVLEHHRDLREMNQALPKTDKRTREIIFVMRTVLACGLLLMVLWLA